MSKVFLILKNEFLTRVRSKSFIISTILGPFVITAIFILAVLLSDSDERYENILVVDESLLFNNAFSNTEKLSFFYTTEDMVDEVFNESPYTLMLYINEGIIETNKVQLFYKKAPSLNHQAVIKAQLDKAIEDFKINFHKVDRTAYDKIKSSVSLRVFDINKAGDGDQYRSELATVGFIFSYAILIFIISYSGMVMRGVTREKSSRIIEILISSVKPFQLMIGKIIGIGLIGFLQIILWISLSSLLLFTAKELFFQDIFDPARLANGESIAIVKGMDTSINNPLTQNAVVDFISRINFTVMISLFLFYFIFGYMLYGAIFAALGAASDPDSDSQLFSLPAFAPLFFAIFIAQQTITNPDSSFTFWFSIFPLTSPVVMLVRISMGIQSTEIWQLYLSMALLILCFFAVAILAGKIYKNGILMYGKKLSLKTFYHLLKANN